MSKRRLCDVEEAAAEMDFSEAADDIAETDEGIQLVISGWAVYIETLDLTLRKGIVCIREKGGEMFLPDSAVTVIYEGREPDGGRLCYGQEGFAAALADWLDGRMQVERIEQLWCELIMPEINNYINESEEKTYEV